MPFTRHKLQEIKEGNLRARCTLCGQTWTTYHVRSACPGVTVYPFEQLPPYLKTLMALGRQRKYPPDPNEWDAAYRILKAPYYRLVYDERKAVHKPLTEKQLAAQQKREETMRQKYTCLMCKTFYTDRYKRRGFFHEHCNMCVYHSRRYNEQIAWAQAFLDDQTVVLDIRTEPEALPYSEQKGQLLLTSFTALDLVSGELLYEADMRARDDLFYIKQLVCPPDSMLVPYPSVVTLYPSSLHAVRFELERDSPRGLYLFNPRLTELLGANQIEFIKKDGRPVSVYGWQELPHGRNTPEREVLAQVCALHGVEANGSTAEVIRRFVLHLATQEPILIEGLADAQEG